MIIPMKYHQCCRAIQTMALFTYIVLLAILNIMLAKDCVKNNVPEQMAFEKQLRKDLSCDDFRLTPPNNTLTFTVNLMFLIRQFSVDSVAGVMTLHSWMVIRWKDERLKWDPDKYYGIKSTKMISINMWTPGIRLFNSADPNDFDRYYYVWCDLDNTGDVVCALRIIHNARCSVRLSNWPYDQQQCSFEFGAWTTKLEHFRINVTSPRFEPLVYAQYRTGWAITEHTREVNFSSERQLKMLFKLRREAAGLGAIVVYPAVVLTVLSVTSLFLDVRRSVRVSVACFSVLNHFLFLTTLAATMPKHNFDPPNLLLYYRASMVLTVVIVLISFFLQILCKLKSTPPNYIISINNSVFESHGKYLIFPQWNVDDDTMDIKHFGQDWTKCANILNYVFSLVIIVVYISMYFALVPKSLLTID